MVWLPDPWRSLSTPNALGLRSSEPCSSRVIEKPFRAFLSAPALSDKTVTALSRRSSGLLPPGKPRPSLQPECLARGGTVALLSFRASQALPPSVLGREHLRLFLPLPFLRAPNLTIRSSTNLRVLRTDGLAFSPLQGAGLSGLLDLECPPTPSGDPPAADYFFISKPPGISRSPESFS